METYGSLSDIPRPDVLISAYDARMASLSPWASLLSPGFAHSTSAITLVHKIDCVIRTLELLLLDARARRNATIPPICRLPPEIISEIFDRVAVEEQPYPPVDKLKKKGSEKEHEHGLLSDRLAAKRYWEQAFHPGSLGWIRLTHVCRSWRELLLGRKTLWAGALGRLPSADTELLQRSGNHAPLFVSAARTRFHTCKATTIVPLLANLPSSDRLSSLRLIEMHRSPKLIRSVEALCSRRWENLQILEINFLSTRIPTRQTLMSTLVAPSLRIARFEGYFIPFISTSLVQLSLNCSINGDNAMSVTTMGLMDLLRATASTLQDLELIHTLSDDFEEEAKSTSEVTLPQLQRLRFADGDDVQVAFLKRVKLPPTVRIDIDLDLEVDNDFFVDYSLTSLRPLIDTIATSAHAHSMNGLTVFPGDKVNAMCMHLYTGSFDLGAPSSFHNQPSLTDEPKLKLRIENDYDDYSFLATIFYEVARILDPSRFVTMSFSSFPDWGHDDIDEVLEQFTGIRTLHVVDPLGYQVPNLDIPDTFPFLSAHRTTEIKSSPSTSEVAKNPALDMLWLEQRTPANWFTCTIWCKAIAKQLRHTLGGTYPASGDAATDVKPIRVMRVDYMASTLEDDEERMARAELAGLADAFEWRDVFNK
ncbi:hypothetical protein PENSPDRAFT_739305 [Peniophora sp. CONT]|nr:hypothetical protein PENSPDRAFT_739305 [Peniophora sp. CONT]